MLTPAEFESQKAVVCRSGQPSSGDDLLGMEIDCCAYFGDPSYASGPSDLWQHMLIERAQGAEWLILGHAIGRADNADGIATELAATWSDKLRYSFLDAHTIIRTADRVELRAVTQIESDGLWVTAKIGVELK